jgi:hypothetical protein
MLAGFALKIAVNLICDCTQEWVHDNESEGSKGVDCTITAGTGIKISSQRGVVEPSPEAENRKWIAACFIVTTFARTARESSLIARVSGLMTVKHVTRYRYTQGCRCDDCRDANTL